MNEITLKEFLEEKFKHQDQRIDGTNRRLDHLTLVIEKLTETTVTIKKFDSAYHQISELRKNLDTTDNRITVLEGFINIWRYIGAALTTILLAIIIAWLSGRLGV
jgi:methyltransferase-like protein